MEVIVPLIGLGSLYVISNQNKKDDASQAKDELLNQEGFISNSASGVSDIPEVPKKGENIVDNQPVTQVGGYKKERKQKLTPGQFPTSQLLNGVDKYFLPGANGSDSIASFENMAGESVQAKDMKHNNMQPFFGSHVKQPLYATESRMDHMVGSGNQMTKKQEQAPLFKPEESMAYPHGMPSQTSFIQSRMNASNLRNNEKPFEQQRVAPGLGRRGGTEGVGGFNAGMQMRDSWKPKTVDELRVETDPKKTYGGRLLPGVSAVQNRGQQAAVEKNLPDRYWVNTPERYFTTGGVVKGATSRAKPELRRTQGREATKEHYGHSHSVGTTGGAPYVNGNYEAPKRAVLDADSARVQNIRPNVRPQQDGDVVLNGFKSGTKSNNRSTMEQGRETSGFVQSLFKAVTAPISDTLRYSKRENMVGNARPVGNLGSSEITANVLHNADDRTRTTIREMTERRADHYFVGNQGETGSKRYGENTYEAREQQRESTTGQYFGGSGNTQYAANQSSYAAEYNAELIDKTETLVNRNPQGSNVKMFTGTQHMGERYERKQDEHRENKHVSVPQRIGGSVPAYNMMGEKYLKRQTPDKRNVERMDTAYLDALKSNPFAKPFNSVA